jgi:hypothetical protein
MHTIPIVHGPQVVESEWITFPGGELDGKCPEVLCPECRQKLRRAARGATKGAKAERSQYRAPLCFACYRAGLARERALKAAGGIDTASEVRFQSVLPFEPVNHARLERLRVERAAVRMANQAGVGRHTDKLRHAQIAARHALQDIEAGLHARKAEAAERKGVTSSAFHAAELQLPEAWLPFVISR